MTLRTLRIPSLSAILAAALFPGLAQAAGVEDNVFTAIQAIAEGDFATAKSLLTEAETIAPSHEGVVPGYTLAGIFYYQGVMEFFAGDRNEAALSFWRKALEKDLFYSWDTGLVADREAQALFEAIRSEVDSRNLVDIPKQASDIQAYVDGVEVTKTLPLVTGTHLVQVKCPDETLQGQWMEIMEVPDLRALCPGLGEPPAEEGEDDGKKKKKKKKKKK